MNRVVSTILIPLLLMSQNLFSVPHSHAGTSIVEPDGHTARPHVHVHIHVHDHHHSDHHHANDEGERPEDSPLDHVPDHESDAFYASDVQLLNDGRVAKIAKAELATDCVVCAQSQNLVLILNSRCGLLAELTSAALMRPKCALFLQLLSIRC